MSDFCKWMQTVGFAFVAFNYSVGYADSTWIGSDANSGMNWYFNWDNNVPRNSLAIFNGNGLQAPQAHQNGPILTFSELEFTADSEISIFTAFKVNGSNGVVINPGVAATFSVIEHSHSGSFGSATFIISGGPSGDGGGSVDYNLEGYGQFYAYSGSTGDTIVNVSMTGGNNFFEINGSGTSLFDNVSSDSTDDEISLDLNANLTIRGSSLNTINGSIIGDGSLTKAGSGILILNGENSYLGSTLVSEGTFILNGSIPGSASVEGGDLIVSGNMGGDVGVISGTALVEGSVGGNASVSGGVMTVNGSVLGSASVNNGLMVVNGSIANGMSLLAGSAVLNGSVIGGLSVASGAKLQGSGLVDGSLISSGTVAPGNSIGTLYVTNFLPTDSSVFECEVNGEGESDQIVASEQAVLSGTLDVIPLDFSSTAPQKYNIIHAGTSVSGTFSTVTSAVPAFISLSYEPNDVVLTYFPASSFPIELSSSKVFNCFLTSEEADANEVKKTLFALPTSEINQALNQMEPSQFSAQTWNQIANALLVRSSFAKHLEEFILDDECCKPYRSSVWIDGMGQWQRQGSKGDLIGYHDATGGVSLGIDTCYHHFRLGGAMSYTHSHLHWKESVGKGQINSYYAGFYGAWSSERWYVDLSALGSYSRYRTSRHIDFGQIHRYAKGQHGGWEALAGVGAGFFPLIKPFKLGPFVRVDYVYLTQQGYLESGAGSLNLEIDSRQDQLIQSQGGIVLTRRYACGNLSKYGTLTPRLEFSYVNQASLAKSDYYAHFSESECEFGVQGWSFNRNLGSIGAALVYASSSERIGVTLEYDGQFTSRYWNQSGQIVFDIKY